MPRPSNLSRRAFLRNATLAGAAGLAAPSFVPSRILGSAGANERIHLGIIGAGPMGQANLENCAKHPDVAVTGVCDVWQERRDAVVAKHKESAKPYSDYRELLAQKDIDAVIIATPPHWHTLATVAAFEAKKDVYLQKPMTLYPDETIALRNAAARHGRITQIGTQIHAEQNYRRVVEWIRSGRLGKVSVVRTFNVMNQGTEGIGQSPHTDPPKDLDWNFWVGPAPMRPFHPLMVRDAYLHSSFMDFSGGWTPGMAPHIIDLPCWALELGVPLVTSSTGGRHTIRDVGDSPDTQEAHWTYPGVTVTWMMSLVNSYGFDFQGTGGISRRLGIYFHAVNATLYTDYGMHKIIPEGDRLKDLAPPEQSIPPSPGHEREWLDSIKTRKEPSCSISYHYKIDLAITLANLSMRLGRSIRLDPVTEKIVDDPEASKMARPTYRDPWKFPAEYLERAGAV